MSFTNKVIAITGGASGIGQAVALSLAAKGAKLSICDMNIAALQKTSEEIKKVGGEEPLNTVVDVRKNNEVTAWIQKTIDHFGGLHGACNSAGIGGKGTSCHSVADLEDDDWDNVIAVNLSGVMYSTRAQLRNMKSGASIVNIASLAGVSASPFAAPYCASKHGVVGLSASAGREFANQGIRVNSVCPGFVNTPLMSAAPQNINNSKIVETYVPMKRMSDPLEIANLVTFLLSAESSYITGATYRIDGGMTS